MHISLPKSVADHIDRDQLTAAGFVWLDRTTLYASPHPGQTLRLDFGGVPPHGGAVSYTFTAAQLPFYGVQVQYEGEDDWRAPTSGERLKPGSGKIRLIFPLEVRWDWIGALAEEWVLYDSATYYPGNGSASDILELTFSEFPSHMTFLWFSDKNAVIMYPEVEELYFVAGR